jgi:outer membrane autotransporter protein
MGQLSGEPYASQAGTAMESASVTGPIAADRVAQAFAVLAEGQGQVSSYAQTATSVLDEPSGNNALWGQIYGALGAVDAGNGNAAVTSSNGGVVLGLDQDVGDWRLGLMLQAGLSGMQVGALNTSASSTDYGVGIYGGRRFGDTLLSFGATYTRHDNSATRQVNFPGFTDTLNANYASGTTQVFGNVSHEFDLGAVSLKPYAGLAHVSHATDGFTETGGPAALSSAANVVNATFASLGLGVEQQFVVGGDMLLTASGSVGWRHSFVEAPISVNRFGAGPAFSVTGKPVANDVLTLGAGLALDVGRGINLDVTYDGQIGNGTQTHSVQGAWAKRF